MWIILHDQIIPALNSCSFYPLDYRLNYYENVKAYEPWIYLYLKEGTFEKAFKLATIKMDNIFNNIIKSIDEKKDYEYLFDDFHKYLNDIKNICENNNWQ